MINKFSTRLKECRLGKGLNQVQLAEAFSTTQATISRWETGESEPDYETLCRLVQFFEESADFVLGLKEF